jgi:hypothetical protein
MTAKILPITMLLFVLGVFTILLVAFGQAEDLGALATAAYQPEGLDGEALAGRGGLPEDRFDERRLLESVQLQVWENRLFVASDESLEVNVAVYEDNQPLQNREPVLLLTLPDGKRVTYHFSPTNEDGQTMLVLPPVSAPNGTLISYEVCLRSPGGADRCIGENYLIWDYQ